MRKWTRTNAARPRRSIGAMILCIAAGCAPAAPPADVAPIAELAGRTPGAPQNCVPVRAGASLRVIDSDTIIYGTGGTVWLNELRSECPGLRPIDPLIVEPTSGSQYCRGDRIREFEPVMGSPGPVCVLGDFVPYTR